MERDLLLARAEQGMRREMLPLEQAPQMVEAASKVLHGTNLSIYGENGHLVDQIAPIFDFLTRAVKDATQGTFRPADGVPAGTQSDPELTVWPETD